MAVIARSASDEAIHVSACRAMDCFASARNDGVARMERSEIRGRRIRIAIPGLPLGTPKA
jgi:hypothetical protein